MNKRKSPECKIKKVCEYCKAEYYSRTNRGRFCNNTHYAKCMICGKTFIVTNAKLTSNNDWNSLTCSSKCAHLKSVKTKLENNNGKYMSDETIQKIKNTNIERYGGTGYSSDKLSKKAKNTIINKYGSQEKAENIRKQKIKETNLLRYGSTSPFGSIDVQNKSKLSNINKYGKEYYAQSSVGKDRNSKRMKKLIQDGLLDKIKSNNVKKYGVPYTLQLKDVRDKIYTTKEIKYGDKYWCNIQKAMQTKLNKYGDTAYNNQEKCFKTNIERYGTPYTCLLPQVTSNNGHMISKINYKFGNLLKINNIEYTQEYRIDNMSFDFYIPSINTLIEINPSYTHQSTGNRYFGKGQNPPLEKNYHLNKLKLANNNGYRCIHIFDWDNWEKIIYLLMPKQTLYARNLNVKVVPKNICDEFLNKYHLQNTCREQDIRLGLYKDNVLIQLMTFGKPRYNKKYTYELLRLCTHNNYKVVGGAEKLFKYFLDNYKPDTIISYCDISKFSGDVYSKLGFNEISTSGPSLHWSKGKSKHITDNLLRQRGFDQLFGTNYGKGTSNIELMLSNNWFGIYDCGQKTFLWRN